KTGSTSLQWYLRRNAETLAKNGVLVPGIDMSPASPVEGQQVQFFEKLVPIDAAGRRFFLEKITKLVDHARENDSTDIVLSAENLSNSKGFEQLFVNISQITPVKIIAYIRRQDDYIISAWKQWHFKEGGTLEGFLQSRA